MDSDRLNNTNNLNPKFEGFFIQMVMPGQKQKVQEIVTEAFGLDGQVKSLGDNHTEFQVTLKKKVLSVKDAWDKSYKLRSQPGVVDAQPLFAVPLPDNLQSEPIGDTQGQIEEQSNDVEWGLKQVRVFEAWSRFFPEEKLPPGHDIIIGLPDTGYSEHPEIIRNLLLAKGYDFLKKDKDPKDELERPFGEVINNPGHGTSTASIAISPKGAQGNYLSGKAVTGVAPGAKLVPLRVSYSVVLLSVQNLAEAIEYAADNNIHVLSISLGTGFFNQRLRSAIIYAQKRGVIIVAASGTYVPYVVWPAAYDEVIAVTGSNVLRQIWSGASQGPQVDVTAPAEKVWYAKVEKIDNELRYNILQGSGTSFSAPLVAGVAALWLSYHGREQLIKRYGAEKIPFIFNQILRDSCEKFPTWKPDKFGAGIVNAEKVLAAPLPDNVSRTNFAPAQALQQHPAIDSGRLETFAHLFENQLSDSQPKANFIGVAGNNNKLQATLAELLQTTETQLPQRLKEVGQELAFHITTNPKLYQQLAKTLSTEKSDPNQLKTRSLTESSSNNLDSVREILLQNVSEVLKTKLR
ncbi:protease [Tolypothrix sp. NIES-4075]|uniref:S8 family peptidase n=1 Tax=Tolypothrix sp. NIES-4075 TaxID=2005459 RepID=UPI000B5D00A8|nr:S8/S53 family peptidase [Tolypothrix sp. NIES-4075]GAX43283.1 protease [Tolypothrix sp. NIES-4075]